MTDNSTHQRALTDSARPGAPRNAVETVLATIWAECLGRHEVGIDDDFTRLGGNSLQAVQIIARVQQDFELELPFDLLFNIPTIAMLAEQLSQREDHERILRTAELLLSLAALSEAEAAALLSSMGGA